MSFTTDKIRNIAVAGHGGTGKTTLFERLLFAGGVIPRAEILDSGKTTSDLHRRRSKEKFPYMLHWRIYRETARK